jgi:2-keto-4-pentenoate hydratase/2-oxohepta-3-ene-1,7-dioic acid hydratase in catechol pathway
MSELLWTVEEAIAAWSLATFVPGDVVALGAAAARRRIPPAAISPGDEIEITCDDLGLLRHSIATHSPAISETMT